MAINKKRLLKRAEKLRGWVRLDQKRPLLWEKEIIYEGDWKKLDSSGEGIAFAVRRNILNHWLKSLRELRAAGIKSPLAQSHETWDQPEDRLGEVVDGEVRANDKGHPSLFLRILFDDEKSRDIGLKGDVSIGSPEVWHDGTGRQWEFPLQHVASTNAPVIPGLETWRKIAASFAQSNPAKAKTMDLDELIAMLGIEVDESVNSDDGKKALVMAKLKELTGGGASKEGEADPALEQVAASHEDEEAAKRKAAAAAAGGSNGNGNGSPVPQASRVTVAFSHDDPTVELYRDSSLDRINALVEAKTITPAVGKYLTKEFCDSKDIAFDLNHNRGGAPLKKVIELVKLVAKDRPLKDSGRSAWSEDESTIELSHKPGDNPLVKNAEKRAAAAAGR